MQWIGAVADVVGAGRRAAGRAAPGRRRVHRARLPGGDPAGQPPAGAGARRRAGRAGPSASWACDRARTCGSGSATPGCGWPRSRPAPYDLVVGDAFGHLVVPWHLATREMAADIARVLRPDGVYAQNVIDYPPDRFIRAELATVAAVFPHVALIAPPAALAGADRRELRHRRRRNAPLPLDALRGTGSDRRRRAGHPAVRRGADRLRRRRAGADRRLRAGGPAARRRRLTGLTRSRSGADRRVRGLVAGQRTSSHGSGWTARTDAAARRPVPAGRAARRRRHVGGLARLRRGARPAGRGQGARPAARRRPTLPRPAPRRRRWPRPGSATRTSPASSTSASRRRRRQHRPVRGDGAHRRRVGLGPARPAGPHCPGGRR